MRIPKRPKVVRFTPEAPVLAGAFFTLIYRQPSVGDAASVSRPLQLYYENPAGRVYDDPSGFARLVYLPGPRHLADLRLLLNQAGHLLARRGDGRMLIDQRLMQPFSPAEQHLLLHEWLPWAIEACGYCCGAVVQAQNVFARLATVTTLTQLRDAGMHYRYFDDEPTAVAWLQSQP